MDILCIFFQSDTFNFRRKAESIFFLSSFCVVIVKMVALVLLIMLVLVGRGNEAKKKKNSKLNI